MSQIDLGDSELGPTGQLPRGIYPDIIRQNRGGALPRQGIVDRLQTPGLVSLPAVDTSRITYLAQGLKDALGITAEITNQLGNEAVRQRRQEENDLATMQHDAEVSASRTEILEHGAAAKDGSLDIVALQQALQDRKITLRPGDDPVQAAKDWVSSQTAGRSTAYKAKFEDVAQAHAARLFAASQEADQTKARAELTAVGRDAAIASDTPEDLAATEQQFYKLNPRGTQTDWLEQWVKPAILARAVQGGTDDDKATLDSFMDVLGDRLPDVKAKAEAEWQQANTNELRRKNGVFNDDIARLELADASPQTMIDYAQNEASNGRVDPEVAARVVNAQRTREGQIVNQSAKQQADAVFNAEFSKIVTAALPEMDGGAYIGGDRTIHVPPTKGHPDGQDFEVKDKDIVEAARQQRWALFDKEAPPNDPATAGRNLSLKLNWLKNVPTAVDPQIVGALTGVSGMFGPDSDPAKLPPKALEAFTLYRQIDAQAPGVLHSGHIKDEDKLFFQAATDYADNLRMTPQQAMIAASQQQRSKALHNERPPISRTENKTIIRAASSVPNIKNDAEARETIAHIADLQRAVSPFTDQQAVDYAVKVFNDRFKAINGYWVNVGLHPEARDQETIDAVGRVAIDQFLNDNPSLKSDKAQSLYTLAPIRGGDGWRVVDMNGVPVGEPYSNGDVAAVGAAIQRRRDAERSLLEFRAARNAPNASFMDEETRRIQEAAITRPPIGGEGLPTPFRRLLNRIFSKPYPEYTAPTGETFTPDTRYFAG